MRTKLLPLLLLCSLFFIDGYAQYKSTWSNDIIVKPSAGKYYRDERVAVGFNGTVYVSRIINTAPGGGNTFLWEILQSTDNGVTYDTFSYAYVGLQATQKLTAFDMIAAGNDSATFKLFFARCYVDTLGAEDTVTMTIDTFNLYFNTGDAMHFEKSHWYDPYHRGITSISLATDARDKNSGASPYSIAVVAAKSEASDSIIVFTDAAGGLALNRVGTYGTLNEIRNVSASIGSSSGATYGRLGIAWDEYQNHTDSFGVLKVKLLNPNDGTPATNAGPYTIGVTNAYRRPCITLSQAAGNAGAALSDIRACVAHEYYAGGGVDVIVRVADSIVSNVPNFGGGFAISQDGGDQLYPNGVYDVTGDKFLYTYYNTVNKTLPYVSKTVGSPITDAPTVVMANYRYATSVITTKVAPHMDMGMMQGSPAFVWNDNYVTMYDAQFLPSSVAGIVNVKDMKLYPNPAVDKINVDYSAMANEKANVSVVDITGREMLSYNITVSEGTNNTTLDVGTLPAGNYFIKLRGSKTEFTSRFTVLK